MVIFKCELAVLTTVAAASLHCAYTSVSATEQNCISYTGNMSGFLWLWLRFCQIWNAGCLSVNVSNDSNVLNIKIILCIMSWLYFILVQI